MTKREIARMKRLELIKKRASVVAEGVTGEPVAEVVAKAEEIIQLGGTLQAQCARFEARQGCSVDEVSDFKAKALICRVYGSVINPRLRLIEFKDGSHGRMWVRRDELPMTNWVVWCRPDPDHVNDYILHGQYNARGIRTK